MSNNIPLRGNLDNYSAVLSIHTCELIVVLPVGVAKSLERNLESACIWFYASLSFY